MMTKHIVSAAVLIAMLSGTAAYAAQSKSGEIKSIDAKKLQVVLVTGEQFQLPKTFDLKTIKAGEKVTVTYDTKNGKMVASDVKAM